MAGHIFASDLVDPARQPERPVDDDHALRVGQVAGLLSKFLEQADEPIRRATVHLLSDEDGYLLDSVRVTAPSGTYLVAVIKEHDR